MRKYNLILAVFMLAAMTASPLACTAAAALDDDVASAIDLVVVIKSERIMYLYDDGMLVDSFPVSLGNQPVGAKRQRGDQRTPEGSYVLDWHNPNSHYYRSIHISYPNARDRAWARRHGVDPGDSIMIHGQPNNARYKRTGDWTNGCIALSDEAMDSIWNRIADGTPIHILP